MKNVKKSKVTKMTKKCMKKVNKKYWFCRRYMLSKKQRRKTRVYTRKNKSKFKKAVRKVKANLRL